MPAQLPRAQIAAVPIAVRFAQLWVESCPKLTSDASYRNTVTPERLCVVGNSGLHACGVEPATVIFYGLTQNGGKKKRDFVIPCYPQNTRAAGGMSHLEANAAAVSAYRNSVRVLPVPSLCIRDFLLLVQHSSQLSGRVSLPHLAVWRTHL